MEARTNPKAVEQRRILENAVRAAIKTFNPDEPISGATVQLSIVVDADKFRDESGQVIAATELATWFASQKKNVSTCVLTQRPDNKLKIEFQLPYIHAAALKQEYESRKM